MDQSAQELLEFWFSPEVEVRWFNSTPKLDDEIRQKYEALWLQAKNGELVNWLETAEGSLALLILLDQLPLNMYRNQAESFATEALAIKYAKQTVTNNFDKQIPIENRAFVYMPLMHSENIDDQNLSVELFEKAGLEGNHRFALHHRDIIERFGRFPHRNSILGRNSTAEEIEYLNSDKAFTG